MRGALLAVTLLAAGGAAAQDRQLAHEWQVSLFAGQHVGNSWQDVFDTSDDLEYANAGLVGVGIGKDWRRQANARFSWGVEFQAVSQFGDQDHIEINVPFVVRYDIPQPLPITILRSLAFGLGPSYATKVPQYEVDSRGESQQVMAYWMMEAEFGPEDARNSFFTRLHHRSGAFGAVADDGGSNVIVLGLRHRW